MREDQRKLPGGTINEWNIDEPRLLYFHGSRTTPTLGLFNKFIDIPIWFRMWWKD